MAIDGQYVICQNAAITINSGKSTQRSLKGLQSMGLPLGAEAQTVDISVIGTRIATKVATGLTYSSISSNYYFMKNDPSQLYLMDASRNGTLIQDMWFWIDGTDFVALDKVNDSAGGMMIGTMSSPQAEKNAVFSGTCELITAGSHIFFTKHAKATTAVFSITAGGAGVSATATSTDTPANTYGFVDELGFAAGDVVIIHGLTGHLDTVYYAEIGSVTNTTMTFVDGVGDEATLPTTAAAATVQIHGAIPIEVVSSF